MNILEQFETIARQRLSEHGKVKIHSVKIGKIIDEYLYEISAYVNGQFVFAQRESQGATIDKCIEQLPLYEVAERVQLKSE